MNGKKVFAKVIVILMLFVLCITPVAASENNLTHQGNATEASPLEVISEENASNDGPEDNSQIMPIPTSCFHSWWYTANWGGETHTKTCYNCHKSVEEPHDLELHHMNNDDRGHRFACTLCTYTSDYIPHDIEYYGVSDTRHIKECKVCGYDEFEDHSPSGLYHMAHDWDEGHYQNCSLCDDACEVVPHNLTYQQQTNSVHKARCEDCGYIDYEAHDLPDLFYNNYDDNVHYWRCSKCNDLILVPHNLEYAQDTATKHIKYCSKCEFDTTENHSWEYVDDGSNGHKKVCSICQYEQGTEPHSLTYSSNGYYSHTCQCDICGYTNSNQNHTWDGIVIQDPYPHEHCIHCGQMSPNENCDHNTLNKEPIYENGSTDPSNHSVICGDCQMDFGTENHNFVLTKIDNNLFIKECTECGYSEEVTP